jgi:hypothetical protein
VRRLGVHDRADQPGLALTLEGPLAGRHLEQHATESEQVGAGVRLPPLELLRRHVLVGAEDRALRRQRLAHRRRCGEARRVPDDRGLGLGQTEVEQLRAFLRQHDVARLQVAVNDALTVRLVQRVCDLDRVTEQLVVRQRPALETRGEGLALQVFHDEIVDAVLVADVEQRADVRVGQRRDRSRLALHPLSQVGVRRQVRRQHLDRHRATEPWVLRLVDLTHPAGSELAGDLVRS